MHAELANRLCPIERIERQPRQFADRHVALGSESGFGLVWNWKY
jgi:hypothetical protein